MNPKPSAGPRVCAPDSLPKLPAQNSNLSFTLSGTTGTSLELAGEEATESENRGQVTRPGNEPPGRQLWEQNNKIIVQTSQLESRPVLSPPNAHHLGPGSFQSPTEASLLPENLSFNNRPVVPTEHLAGRQGTRLCGSLALPKAAWALLAMRQRPEAGTQPSLNLRNSPATAKLPAPAQGPRGDTDPLKNAAPFL